MPNIRLERKIELPIGLAFPAIGEILHSIEKQERGWQDFALHADLGDVGLPDVGYIAVPIALQTQSQLAGINHYKITIRAARHAEAFPAFNGAVGADMSGPSESLVWLSGDYEIPFGTMGALLNIGIAGKVAERSLDNFLSDVTQGARARVNKSESEFMRYALFRHGG